MSNGTYFEKNPLFPGSMPYAIKVGETFRLYHPGSGGLQMRTSKDGFQWSEPRKVMTGCLDPCVIQVGENNFHLYYCNGGRIKKDGKQVWEFKTTWPHPTTASRGRKVPNAGPAARPQGNMGRRVRMPDLAC